MKSRYKQFGDLGFLCMYMDLGFLCLFMDLGFLCCCSTILNVWPHFMVQGDCSSTSRFGYFTFSTKEERWRGACSLALGTFLISHTQHFYLFLIGKNLFLCSPLAAREAGKYNLYSKQPHIQLKIKSSIVEEDGENRYGRTTNSVSCSSSGICVSTVVAYAIKMYSLFYPV